MSHQYRVRDPEEIYFVTFTIVDWVDVFTRPEYKQVVIDSLKYCQQNKGLQIYAFCLMTNHLHLLVSKNDSIPLPDIIRDFKKHTNKQIIALVTEENESRRDWMMHRFAYHAKYDDRIKNYKVWQDGYHAITCNNVNMLQQKLDYIHNNPVRAGIVERPEYYLYSSAANYSGDKGLIDVVLLSLGVTL